MASRLTRVLAQTASLAGVVILISSCGGKEKLPEVYLLTGECKIEVSTPHPKAEIFVDGIHLGRGRVSSDLPCGEKQVKVQLDGFVPYKGYHNVKESKTLLVPVQLKVQGSKEVYSLSEELIMDLQEGKVAQGAVAGGASKAAVEPGEEVKAGPTVEDINWDDWS